MKALIRYVGRSLECWTFCLLLSVTVYGFVGEFGSLKVLSKFIQQNYVSFIITIFSVYIGSLSLITTWLLSIYKSISSNIKDRKMQYFNLFNSCSKSLTEFFIQLFFSLILFVVNFYDNQQKEIESGINHLAIISINFCIIAMVGIIIDGIKMIIFLSKFYLETFEHIAFKK